MGRGVGFRNDTAGTFGKDYLRKLKIAGRIGLTMNELDIGKDHKGLVSFVTDEGSLVDVKQVIRETWLYDPRVVSQALAELYGTAPITGMRLN